MFSIISFAMFNANFRFAMTTFALINSERGGHNGPPQSALSVPVPVHVSTPAQRLVITVSQPLLVLRTVATVLATPKGRLSRFPVRHQLVPVVSVETVEVVTRQLQVLPQLPVVVVLPVLRALVVCLLEHLDTERIGVVRSAHVWLLS